MQCFEYPVAPRNVQAFPTYLISAIDVRWDDPAYIIENSPDTFEIIGHRVYRSDESPDKGFQLVSDNQILVSRAFRDRTKFKSIYREDVSHRFVSKGDNERQEWIFQTLHKPIVSSNNQLRPTELVDDVTVEVYTESGLKKVAVRSVRGEIGEVTLVSTPYLELSTNRIVDPILPNLNGQSGRCFCSYKYAQSLIQVAYDRPYYYRVTTVARRKSDGIVLETPLSETNVASTLQFDEKDYIWARANQLNCWMLEQAGERLIFFLRKQSGVLCECFDRTHGRSRADCPKCYGTKWVGGYEGPFEAYGTPMEGSKSLNLSEMGVMVNLSYDLSILDGFLLNPGDFMIRQNSQRFLIHSVTPVGPRGTVRVQTISTSRMPESDYRHNVPVHPTQTALSGPLPVDAGRTPDILKSVRVDTEENDRTELKGKSLVFANIMQGR